MYHKLRNTLAGLGMVLAIFTGGILLSDPLPAKAAPQPLSVEAQQAALTLAVLQAAVSLAQAGLEAEAAEKAAQTEPPRHAPAPAPSRLKLELGMPFYSFGTVLPRRRES